MLPTMNRLVAGTLGNGWCVFVTWQMFVGLCCEVRKYLDETRDRLPGSSLRAPQYLNALKVMCFAYGIDMGLSPSTGDTPTVTMKLPHFADRTAVSFVLDLFAALLHRFASLKLERPHPPVLRGGSNKIIRAEAFKKTRINQWSFELDGGFLSTFAVIFKFWEN